MPNWLNMQAYAFDRPLKYKELSIYPAKMENYFEFHIFVRSLLLEKNATLAGISKTYLDYLYTLQENEDKELNLSKFDSLLKLCLRQNDFKNRYVRKEGKPIFIIEDKEYDSNDFDELRLIICEQNDISIPDETIQKEVRDSMEEAKRLKAKLSGTIPPTLEDQVVCIMASTSLRPEDIANLSIRKFGQLLQRVDAKLHYQVYLTASISGTKFKDKTALKHWMSGNEVNRWKDTMISIETLKGKLGGNTQDNKNN